MKNIAARIGHEELQGLLDYKAALPGSLCSKLHADYTSLPHPIGAITNKANRPEKGLLVCRSTLHVEVVGARVRRIST